MSSTHIVDLSGPVVAKTYRSWTRGEPRREWSVLHHLHRHAPGLAPAPVSAGLDGDPPAVTMTRLPGAPLDARPGTPEVDALTTALRTLWSVPVAAADPWRDDLAFARRLTTADWPRPSRAVVVARRAAADWWDGPDPVLLSERPTVLVLGHRDPNLTNYIWDGRRVRIVDFEDSRTSDPATELALLAEHLSARQLDVDIVRAAFEVDERRLRAARRLWAMYWLWLLRPGGPAARRNPPGTADDQARRLLTLLAG